MARHRIRVRRAKTAAIPANGHRNWIVEHERLAVSFVFPDFENAIWEAQRLAKTALLDPFSLISAQRHWNGAHG